MRLYRTGNSGEPVRDIQDRLFALGYSCRPDLAGRFEEATARAVAEFQEARGLSADGIVGPQTWNALVAAGYRLGDRTIYYRVPMMRGDDVAEVQRRLNSLGFDAGKVDGIFGPETMDALMDFQRNRNMEEDGIVGTAVVTEFELIERATRKPGRETVRERQWLQTLAGTLAGRRVLLDPFARDQDESASAWGAAMAASQALTETAANPLLSRSADTAPSDRTRATRANRLGVDLVVAFAETHGDDPGVYFFASEHSASEAGRTIADAVASALGLSPIGRSIPILRETRMPAIVVSTELSEKVGRTAVDGLVTVFASDFAAQP
ncbi:MAG: peptidoglycan-binding protein [Acidimicrobiia bacterium]|nr:peptidoglycan-binding protein [Acidimicrobiia bacterium]